jgi:predicted HNH restriction endonuclease
MIIYLYETLSTALSSFAYLSKQSHHLLKHGLMANCSNCHELVDRGARSLPYRG